MSATTVSTRTMPRVPIRLSSVEVLALDLPMITTFKTAHGTTSKKRTIIIRAEDSDGVVGWGECPASGLPLYSADTFESSWYALTALLVPLVAGRDFAGPAELAAAYSGYQGYNMAKHGLECAAWAIASALRASTSCRSRLAMAAAYLMVPRAQINRRSKCSPLIGKFSTARCVEAP